MNGSKYTIYLHGNKLFIKAKGGKLHEMTGRIAQEQEPKNMESLVTFTVCKGCGKVADKSFTRDTEHCDMCVPCEEFAAGMR